MKILIVDDEIRMGRILADNIRDTGHYVKDISNPITALKLIGDEDFDVLITDVNMPEMNGIDLLSKAKEISPNISVIIMTAYATVQSAVEALRNGAVDYLIKPFSMDELNIRISRIDEKKRLEQELIQRRDDDKSRFGSLLGNSQPMNNIRLLIEKVAQTDATVLITGASGVGKELVAREIHFSSKRAKGPFVPINCAAITETLLESELFGYEKGAFTGANKSKSGRFELAQNGTLFLDEIGEIPLSIQVKLLRVIQEREIYRVGGIQPIKVDVRIITATNRDLKKAMTDNKFREDLYFRIAVFPIDVPSLSERKDDIPLLVKAFLNKFNKKIDDVDSEVFDTLIEYDWPGNIRELENLIERAVILAGDSKITLDHIPLIPDTKEVEIDDSQKEGLFELEKELLIKTLDKYNGNKSRSAKALGITRRMLYTRMKKFGLE